MEQFGLLRIDYPHFDEEIFREALTLLSKTQYSLTAYDSDSPSITHCVSAVRFLINKSTGWQLPHYYVGDMCRKILDNPKISCKICPFSEGQQGDLVFFQNRSTEHRAYMITHVGILVDDTTTFFHSSYGNGGRIDSLVAYCEEGRIATCKMLSRYTDPRGGNIGLKS